MKICFSTAPVMTGILELRPNDVVIESTNPATELFFDLPIESLRNRSLRTLNASEKDIAFWSKRCAFSEQQRQPVEFDFTIKEEPEVQWFSAIVNFIHASPGGCSRFSFTIVEITRRKRTEQNLALLNDLSATLSKSLDPNESLQEIAGDLLARFAGCCLIDIFENETLSRSMFRFAKKEHEAVQEEIIEDLSPMVHPLPSWSHVIRSGRAELYPEIPESVWEEICPSSQRLGVMKRLGFDSALVVPIRTSQRILGGLTLLSAPSSRRYDELDLALAEDLGKRLGQALENSRLYLKAREAVALREDFLGIASHDLKNPLASIRLSAQLVSRAIDHKDMMVVKKAASTISRTVDEMNRLIEDLLDIGRIESGVLVVDRKLHRLREIFEQAEEMLRPIASEKNIQIELECEKPDLIAFCDRSRILQLISNLVGNAIKFTPPGGNVSVGAAQHLSGIQISVRDSGPGISAEHLAKIFDRFWQAPATKRQGTGLGLYIAKGIVEAHGGRIWAQSTANGSTFYATLPVSSSIS